MLYLFYGSDFKKARKKLASLLKGLEKKRPDASVFRITDEDFLSQESGEEMLKDLIKAQGLFGGNYIVVCDGIFEFEKEFVLENLKTMANSEHIFIFIEEMLKKPDVGKFEKNNAHIEIFGNAEKEKSDFNIFSLSDAIGARDKQKAWRIYLRALDEGLAPEQIQGTMFWQIKTMNLISSSTKNPGLSPFVYQKSKKFLKEWSQEELKEASGQLVEIYHGARRGEGDHSHALEEWLLSI